MPELLMVDSDLPLAMARAAVDSAKAGVREANQRVLDAAHAWHLAHFVMRMNTPELERKQRELITESIEHLRLTVEARDAAQQRHYLAIEAVLALKP